MMGMEKDILLLISRVRCITETQVGKVFSPKKRYVRKPFKKTLKKMCNEFTLRKCPCNINYSGYKENSYVYYLNGSKVYKGTELAKAVVGSEIAIKFETGGYEIKRLYRNAKISGKNYDLFIEYTNNYDELLQVLIDIDLEGEVSTSKYRNLHNDIENSTIPFYGTPRVLVVTSKNIETLNNRGLKCEVNFINLNLSKIYKYI